MNNPKVNVRSEVKALKKVLVHRPGPELYAVTPQTRQEFLYDDIIDLEGAREEHRRFTSILSRFAEVLEVNDLLKETFEIPEARQFIIERSREVTNDPEFGTLLDIDSSEMSRRFIEGWRSSVGLFSNALGLDSFILPPIPNLYFTRDAAMVCYDQIIVGAMRFSSRWPEEVLMRTLFEFSPSIGGQRVLYDGSTERRFDFHLEGGDLHPIDDDLVVVGCSDRSSAAAIDILSDLLFEQTGCSKVILVLLPENSTAIHLDMVWTQLDHHLAAAHPPFFRGPRKSPALLREKGQASVRQFGELFEALNAAGKKIEPVWTGGREKHHQAREQWSSACNFLAVAPGQVLAYERNEHTLQALVQAGFRMIEGDALLLGDESLSQGEKAVITFEGAELVRGGGGPRCMTCPLVRE